MLGGPEILVLAVVIGLLFVLPRVQRLLESRVDEVAMGRRAFEAIAETRQVTRLQQGEAVDLLARFARARTLRVGTYSVHVTDEPEVNAMALPGGIVLLTRGLVRLRERGEMGRDELAAVLAHEVAHIELGHSRRREVQATMSNWATRLGPAPGGPLGRVAVGLGLSAMQRRASRDAEREADAWAVEMLGAAGFDPGALGVFLRRLEGWGSGAGGLWSTHPSPAARRAALP